MTFLNRELKKKRGGAQAKTRLIFWFVASGYLKELNLNSPRDFFFSLCFLSFSGQLRICWLLENLGDFEKENLGWLLVTMELCRLIFYSKMMLVNPYQAGIHLKVCSVVERDGVKPFSLSSHKVLKHSAPVWRSDVSGQC